MTTLYDQTPYLSQAYDLTNPERIEIAARLAGASPCASAGARVLEIGCGDGANLANLAYIHPRSSFFGFDLAATAIERAQKRAAALGLNNLEFLTLNILDVDERIGRFDYIICHGIYSWVPEEVQRKILSICRDNLNPTGVALVSYNIYPGWLMRGMVRQAMVQASPPDASPGEQIRLARLEAERLGRAIQAEKTPHVDILRRELERVGGCPDWFLVHDYLAPINRPEYLIDFAAQARESGLRYLTDVDPARDTETLPPAPREVAIGDQLRDQQRSDMVRNASFRRSLLVHEAAAPAIRPGIEIIDRLFVSGRLQRERGPGTVFRTAKGTVTISDPRQLPLAEALEHAWPRAVPVRELLRGGDERAFIRELMLSGIARLHIAQPPCLGASVSGAELSAVARYEASYGAVVSSLRHQSVMLSDLERRIARYDGPPAESGAIARALSAAGESIDEPAVSAAYGRFLIEGLLKAATPA